MRELSSAGEYVCSECGLVAPHAYIDETSEYRQFALEHGVKNKSRSDYAGLDGGEDLSTSIAYDGSPRARKLALLNQRMTADSPKIRRDKHHRNIRDQASVMNLEKHAIGRAQKLFDEVMTKDILKNTKHVVVDAACIYHACNLEGVSRPLQDFVHKFGLSKREFNKTVEIMKDELPSLQNTDDAWETQVKLYIPRLKLTPLIEEAAIAIAKSIHDHEACSGAPQPIIAAVLAYTSQLSPDSSLHRSLEQVSAVVGPKPETIRKRFDNIKVLRPMLSRLPAFQKLEGGA
jgi:transcription initiation factor TFIIB